MKTPFTRTHFTKDTVRAMFGVAQGDTVFSVQFDYEKHEYGVFKMIVEEIILNAHRKEPWEFLVNVREVRKEGERRRTIPLDTCFRESVIGFRLFLTEEEAIVVKDELNHKEEERNDD